MAGYTVTSSIPAVVVILDEATLDVIHDLAEKAAHVVVASPEDRAPAEALFNEIDQLAQAIEAKRVELTAPALAYQRAIMAAAKEARAVLQPTLDALGGQIAKQLRLEREIAEEQKRAAAAEAKRKQEEENARADTAAAFSGAGVTEALPARILPPKPPPPPTSSAVKPMIDHVLVIPDRAKVPVEFAGAELRPIDEALLKRLLKGGIKCDFARLDQVESFARKGSR